MIHHDHLHLHTDASVSSKNNKGGWACIFSEKNVMINCIKGFEENITTSDAELVAIINGLGYYKNNYSNYNKVTVVTDAKFIYDVVTRETWHKWNFTQHSCYWRELKNIITELSDVTLNFFWVQSHSGHLLNDLADLESKRARIRS